jgi:deoxyhypusine synthase
VKYAPFDFGKIKTYPLKSRPNKVTVKDFGQPAEPLKNFGKFLDSLPDILGARSLRSLTSAIKKSRKKKRPVVMAMGGHVIKCGLAPVIIDLMRRKIITALVLNGSAAIHDLEIAVNGGTSEDVSAVLHEGHFGMAEETGKIFNGAAATAAESKRGLGDVLSETISRIAPKKYKPYSLLAAAHELEIPLTVHVALGTDIVHVRKEADGAALGESSMTDFKILCSIVADLAGGVWLNVGSAVLLPEIFLKAVSAAKNTGHSLDGLVTANLDMLQSYRATTNVTKRPAGENGFNLTGHHEIMLPLLRMALIS